MADHRTKVRDTIVCLACYVYLFLPAIIMVPWTVCLIWAGGEISWKDSWAKTFAKLTWIIAEMWKLRDEDGGR